MLAISVGVKAKTPQRIGGDVPGRVRKEFWEKSFNLIVLTSAKRKYCFCKLLKRDNRSAIKYAVLFFVLYGNTFVREVRQQALYVGVASG